MTAASRALREPASAAAVSVFGPAIDEQREQRLLHARLAAEVMRLSMRDQACMECRRLVGHDPLCSAGAPLRLVGGP